MRTTGKTTMTIAELEQMSVDQLVDWLKVDAFKHEPEVSRVHATIFEAAKDGRLSDDSLDRWMAATRRVNKQHIGNTVVLYVHEPSSFWALSGRGRASPGT